MQNKKYSVIIHGGCGTFDKGDTIEEEHQKEQKESLDKIIKKSWSLVESGKSAMDIVEETVKMLEDSPAFNAGIGSAIGKDKQIELDASIMDGSNLDCGAVACVSGYKNPISLARLVLNTTPHAFLIGEGAAELAQKNQFKKTPIEKFYTPYQLHWWKIIQNSLEKKDKQAKGTVGVVVKDKKGNIAAGTSTGGLTSKMKGRVGDSPMIGAGTYADNRNGGACATGYGEQIIKVSMTKFAIDAIGFKKVNAQKAAKMAIAELGKLKNGLGGIIVIDKNGNIGAFANEKFLPRAYMTNSMKNPKVEFAVRDV